MSRIILSTRQLFSYPCLIAFACLASPVNAQFYQIDESPPTAPPPPVPPPAAPEPPSPAQEPAPEEVPPQAAFSVEEDAQVGPATQEAPVASVSPSALRKKAMTKYVLGDTDAALAEMKALLQHCLDVGDDKCSPNIQSVFYADIGVILAGGKDQHDAAVRTFRRALKLWPNLTIEPEYRSTKVNMALAEARGESPQTAPVAVPQAVAPGAATAAPQDFGAESGWDQQEDASLLFAAHATMTASVLLAADNAFGQVGGGAQALAAAILGGTFTVGGRVMGGYTYVPDFDISGISPGFGSWGINALAGGTNQGSDGRSFYYMGGFGFNHVPERDVVSPSLHVLIGSTLNGLSIGGGGDVIFRNGATEMLLTFNIGYGDLFL